MKLPIFLILVWSSFSAALAQVSVITFHGTITAINSSGTISGVSVGDPFLFRVQYDFSPTHTAPSFEHGSPIPYYAGYTWLEKGYTISASFGDRLLTTTNNTVIDVRERTPPNIQHGFAVYNAYPFSSGGFSGEFGVALISGSPDGPVFPSASLGSVVEYPVSDFDQNFFRALGNFDGTDGQVFGTITSYEVVPEPATAWCAGSVLVAFALYRRRGKRNV